jgi:predicted secreted protein
VKKIQSLAVAVLAFVASQASNAQVVPFHLEGSFVGNLITLEAYGHATGTQLGNCTFIVSNQPTGTFDTYTAADGSTLKMKRDHIDVTFTPAGGNFGDNFFYLSGLDYWQIVGGTGRFATATSAGDPIVSTFFTPDPVDITGVYSDLTAIPANYFKDGKMNLGRRR